MIKKIILILFFALNFSLDAQNDSIKTINFSDNFQFLKKELKDVKVVMLGEITHNDGNVFELKTEIIKYLYKELGFKTIAFESGTYDLWKAEQVIETGKNITTAFQNSLFSIWSNAKEFQSFISFFEKNKNDLKLFGFDNQITGNYGEKLLFNDLFNYCKKENISFKLNQTDLELLIESILYVNFFDEKDISYKNYNTSLNNLLQKISKKPINETRFYWKQIIKNLISLGKESYLKKHTIISSFGTSKSDNIRDQQMADNLLAYITKHPNEKIICWGANQHFTNNMNSIKEDTIKDFIPMGSYIKIKLKQKAYSLAMITAEDSIKLGGHWSKTPINKSSFEWFLKQKKQPLLFISSNQKSLNKKRLNRFFSPTTFINSNLSELHDGYIYLDKATPSNFISGTKNVVKVNKSETNKSSKNKISGQVLDKKSKETIPFVSVLIKDSYVGTSTNENGNFVIYSPNSLIGKSIIISSLGYKTAIINLNNNTSKIELEPEDTLLDEVIIQSKTTAKTIVTKAINNFKKNYPTQHFNAINYSNAQIKVNNKALLDFDVVLDYYSRGYNKSYRPTQNIKEIRWNIKEIEPAKKFRYFFDSSYNSIVSIKFRSQKKKNKKVYI